MIESDVEAWYRNVVDQIQSGIAKKYHKRSNVTNITLDAIGKNLIRGYKGSYPYDKLPDLKNGEKAIINQDSHDEPGSHWMAVCRVNGKLYGYDSFARNIERLIPIHKSISNDTKDREQTVKETNCGARSLAFLYAVDELGIDNAMKI